MECKMQPRIHEDKNTGTKGTYELEKLKKC